MANERNGAELPGRNWSVSIALTGLLLVAFSSSLVLRPRFLDINDSNPMRSSDHRLLQSGTTMEYFILLHLSLEYVDDNLASQFKDPASDAVNHFCSAVNEQVRLFHEREC